MDFDGKVGKRTSVSLRGRSEEPSKMATIRRAKIQREERARERAMAAGASTLQRVWRGWSVVRKARLAERRDMMRKLHDIKRVREALGGGEGLAMPLAVMIPIVRQLLFFYCHSEDASAFRDVSELLLPSLRRAPDRAGIDLPLSRVCSVCLVHAALGEATVVMLSLLESLTSPEFLPETSRTFILRRLVLGGGGIRDCVRLEDNYGKGRAPRFERPELLPILVGASRREEALSSPTSVFSCLCLCARRVLDGAEAAAYDGNLSLLRDGMGVAFSRALLPLPELLDGPLKQGLVDYMTSAKSFVALKSLLLGVNQDFAGHVGPVGSAWALSNVLQLWQSLPEKGQGASLALASALRFLLPQSHPVLAQQGRGGPGASNDDDEEEDSDGAGTSGTSLRLDAIVRREVVRRPGRLSPLPLEGGAEGAAEAALQKLMSPATAPFLLQAVLPADDVESGGLDCTLSLCAVYGELLMSCAARRAAEEKRSTSQALLNALAFSRKEGSLVARLWGFLAAHIDLQHYARQGSACLTPSVADTLPSTLYLLFRVYSHQLVPLDDQEFYERQYPLSLDAVRHLVSFLRQWLLRLLWQECNLGALTLREVQLLESGVHLFNHLHDRSTRRAFMDPEAWCWPALRGADLEPPLDAQSGEDEALTVADYYVGGGGGGASLRPLPLVLANVPQVVPFMQRAAIFRRLVRTEREGRQDAGFSPIDMEADFFGGGRRGGSSHVRIRRDHLYEDSFRQLSDLGDRLKGGLKVSFVNEHGLEEAGIDGGGVLKEYMDSVTRAAFSPDSGLFVVTNEELLFPNRENHALEHFRFAGRVLGKAVLEDILVEPLFSLPFLNSLLGHHNHVDDLFSLDQDIYRSLMQLKAYSAAGGGRDVRELSLTFSVDRPSGPAVELVPGGASVEVTNANVINYIHLMAHFYLNVECREQCRAFLAGFRELIPAPWIRMFSPQELQRLIGGDSDRPLDVLDMRANMKYAGGYHPSQPIIQAFWEVIEEMTAAQHSSFLKFVTSCSRQPLMGFAQLVPPICVQKVPSGDMGNKLPSASTCMNLLKLPEYGDKGTLRAKLLYAIEAAAGFELT